MDVKESIVDPAAGVEGWLAEREGALLFSLASRCAGRGVIVEIGSWKGKSTIWLGKGSMAGNRVKIWAIDPHTGSPEHHDNLGTVWTFEEFLRNIARAGIQDVVIPVVKSSAEAAKTFQQPIELIFVDGAHEYESVRTDFELWFPKVIDGGVMAFHDTTGGGGPWKVVQEKLYSSGRFGRVHVKGSITYAMKVHQTCRQDRLYNLFSMCVRRTSEPMRRFLPAPVRLVAGKVREAL